MADDGEQLGLAAEVTVAWLSNPHTRAGADDVSAMLGSILSAIRGLGEPKPGPEPTSETRSLAERTPVVTRRQSLASPDYIISMIDATKHRSLKRHLRNNGLTPDEYRKRFGLNPDYPMVARGYSEARRAVAKQHQFGRKPARDTASEPTEDAAPELAIEPTLERQDQRAPEPAIEAAPEAPTPPTAADWASAEPSRPRRLISATARARRRLKWRPGRDP